MDPAFYPSFCTTCMQMNCKEHMAIPTLENCDTLRICPTCLKIASQCVCGKKPTKVILCGCFCDSDE